MNDDKSTVITLGQVDLTQRDGELTVNLDDAPVLPTRNLVLFPGVTLPIALKRENSLEVARLANERNISVCLLCQCNPETDIPEQLEDFYSHGVMIDVLKVIELPDGQHSAIIHAREHVRVLGEAPGFTMPEAMFSVHLKAVNDTVPRATDNEYRTLATLIKDTTLEILEITPGAPDDFKFNLRATTQPDAIINMVCSLMPLPADVKVKLLAERSNKERGFLLLAELSAQRELANLTKSLLDKTQANITEIQRNNFLNQQLETIKQELYGDKDDATKLQERGAKVRFTDEARKHFESETEKLSRISPNSADYSVQLGYLETLLALPWETYSVENTDFALAGKTLDSHHYGLDKIKERILEQIAVLMNNPTGKAPILCLVGAPGVGKTSLGRSVAEAMGRKYVRVSLGGLHDEAEIRGHRRTYIGAMPGRIMDAIKRAGTSNPVLLLDEVDKIGKDFKGDPSAALLEVLDPEQNCRFHDNYVDVDYDLSKVLFIATANTLQGMSQPLLDRMEIIEIPGYLLEEKLEIATKHLIPDIFKANNLDDGKFTITTEAVRAIVEGYTAESGVRQLEKQLNKIVRSQIKSMMAQEKLAKKVTAANVAKFLGVPRYNKDRYEGNEYAGVVTGLAWTAVGGEILYIETSLSRGKGDKLTLTGNLGQVMKESAEIALQWVKAHAPQLGIDSSVFGSYDIHLHVPDGAIPKDGPSAGITMVTSIVSALRQCKVKERVAMTGEITLRGRVMPVGGIREKILAAKRSGITDIILCESNRKDIEEIQAHYLHGLTFHYVNDIREVLDIALTDEKACDAIELVTK